MATHSSVLAWRIPGTGEPGGLPSMGSQSRTQLKRLSSSSSSSLQCWRPRFDPWMGKIPWRRKGQPTPAFLPGKPHGQRSLEGYSLWGRKESDTTEQLTLTFPLPFSVPLFDISADPEQSSNSPVLTLEIIVAFLSHLIAHI